MSERESKIFPNSQLEEIRRRESGDYSDPYGLFSKRIKPKIEEILTDWDRNRLRKLLRPRRKSKER